MIYHAKPQPGKIKVVPTKPYATQRDLALAYSPGVAEPCLEIEKNKDEVYRYTSKGNTVAVISNGTAVLGLGNIGPEASKPVMEGKSLLFKIFADIDGIDIELDTEDVDKFVETACLLQNLRSGTEVQMIGVAQNDLGLYRIDQSLLRNGFYTADRAARHKDRCLYAAMIGLDRSGTCGGAAVCMLKAEFHVAAKIGILD